MNFEISEDSESPEANEIGRGILEYNDSQTTPSRQKPLVVLAKDNEGKVCAGLRGHTNRGWLFVSQLWVSKEMRKAGLGSSLLQMAEAEARKRTCHGAYLDTFSFQALDFYKKLGYEVFGQLEDFPVGHRRYFLQKKL